MSKYFFTGDFQGTTSFSSDLQNSEFMSIDFVGSILSDPSMKNALWEMGEGGSIDTRPLLHEGRIFFGACDKNFYCVDAETGKEIWRFQAAGPIFSSPAIVGD